LNGVAHRTELTEKSVKFGLFTRSLLQIPDLEKALRFCAQVIDGQIELWHNLWNLKALMGTSKFDKAVSERGGTW